MSPRVQKLVNAQLFVNRAVFEANKSEPREDYIDECIDMALLEIVTVNRARPKPRVNDLRKRPKRTSIGAS